MNGQPFIFDRPPEFLSEYNDALNEEAAGFGLGMALYDAPNIVIGGSQFAQDLSKTTVSPQVILSNPNWLLVFIVGAIGIILLMKRNPS